MGITDYFSFILTKFHLRQLCFVGLNLACCSYMEKNALGVLDIQLYREIGSLSGGGKA